MASVVGTLTAGNDVIAGTAGDDIVLVPSSAANLAATDTIRLGDGYDVLLFQRNTDVSASAARFAGLSGVDELDVTAAATAVLSFDDASILQSDADRLTIRFDADPLSLDLRALTSAIDTGIRIAGSGMVTLYDAARQSLTIMDGVNGKVIGGTGRDRLSGGTGADSLTGGAGDDILTGNGGADTLTGGDDQDWLYGGLGNDVLVGGNGFDLISGGAGRNLLSGGAGADCFVVTAGETLVISDFEIANAFERIDLRAFAGLSFASLTITKNGANTQISAPGATLITLNNVSAARLTAAAFIFADDPVVTLAEGLGVAPYFEFTDAVDRSVGTAGSDVFEVKGLLSKLDGADVFSGGAGTDVLRVWGADRSLAPARLAGMSGIEVIDLSGATGALALTVNAAMVAQSDTDTLQVRFGASNLFLDTELAGEPSTVITEGSGTVTLRDVAGQSVSVSDAMAGTVLGGNKADDIQGGARDDSLSGLAGADSLDGGAGNDRLLGGDGDDVLTGGAGRNIVSGGAGTDRFIVSQGEILTISDLAVSDSFERVDLRAFTGLTFANMTLTDIQGGVRVGLPGGASLTLTGVTAAQLNAAKFIFDTEIAGQTFTLSDGADNLVGGAGDDLFDLVGNISQLDAVLDVVNGGAGIDTLRVFGVDRMLGPPRMDVVRGIETIDLTAATGSHSVALSDLQVNSSETGQVLIKYGNSSLSLDTALVTAPNGVVVEGSGMVTLRDIPGQKVVISDTMGGHVSGGNDANTITGGAQGDWVNGFAGNDSMDGKAGHDTLLGGDGNDSLNGGAGDDSLDGGAGNDSLISSGGNDTVNGGTGTDHVTILRGAGTTTLIDHDATNFLERVDLSDFGTLSSVADLTFTNQGHNVRVTAPGLDIVFKGLQASQLDGDDFLFAGQDPLVFNVSAGTSMAQLQQLINEAPPGAEIHLAAGTYSVTQTLMITRSDISLIGAGEGQTIFRTDIATAHASQTILVQSEDPRIRLGEIPQDAVQGSSTVTLNSGHGFQVGDILYLSQANDATWLESTGNTGWLEPASTPDTAEDYYLRETHVRITAVNGNTLTLAEPLPYTFQAGIATAAAPSYLSNVNLSGFSIAGSWGAPDPFLFEDTMPEWASIAALELDGVRDSQIDHITITNPAAHAFKLQRAYDVTGDHLTADGAHDKSGSSGYQFYFNEAFSNDFTHLTAIDGRHAVLFSSYSAEHYNNIQLDFTNRDINFHGSPDAGNVIVIDRLVQDYPVGSDPEWPAVGPGVFPLHPRSTIPDNNVTFLYAVTGDRGDTVTAAAMGGYLSTGLGNDRLIGGAGNDTLDGGENGDILSGGAGRDTFVRQYADFTDTILDFQAGARGDVMLIKGTAYTRFADLNLRQVGADTVLDFGPGGTTTFKNTLVSSFTAENFVLVGDTSAGQTITLKAIELFALGTDKSDTFVISRAHLDAAEFLVRGGNGFDTVKVNTTTLSGALEDTGRFFGIEAFDISAIGTVAISIGSLMAARSDSHSFYLNMGDTGSTVALNIGQMGRGNTVFLDGARWVQLNGGIEHVVKSTDRIGVHITGDTLRDVIYGARANDWIDAARGNDVVFAGAGNDTLNGGAGADLLNGGPGSDIYYIDNLGDKVAESNRWLGTDLVISAVNFQLGTAHVENLTLVGTAIIGAGNGLQNVITGNAMDNILDGGKNNDTLIGGLGDDIYLIRAPGDIVVERAGEGIDSVRAFRSVVLWDNVENLYIQTLRNAAGEGVAGVNGTGNALDNIIVGNPFDNALAGREGNDTLRGQGGADSFVFDRAAAANNRDTILDFTHGEDIMRLKGSLFGLGASGNLAAGAFQLGAVALEADDRILYDQRSGNLYVDLDGSGSAASAQLFAVIANNVALAADDFVLF